MGGFNESIQAGLDDYDFFLPLYRVVPAIVVMPLLQYRRHAAHVTLKAITIKRGFLEIERLVRAGPQNFTAADPRYIAEAAFLAHQRIGIEYARLGEGTDAGARFERSIALRLTRRSCVMLAAARIAYS